MKAVVYFFHCAPSFAKVYQKELDRRGINAEIVPVLRNGLSSVYRRLAVAERDARGYLSGLIQAHPTQRINPTDDDTAIVLASWSAGYGYIMRILGEPHSADNVDGVIFIDSLYGGMHRDGSVIRSGLTSVESCAKRTLEQNESSVLWVGYADVPTCYQKSNGEWTGYSSTQMCAEELVGIVGGQGDGFHVRFFDTRLGARGNHLAAMRNWGPSWMGDALESLSDRRAAVGLDVSPSSTEPDTLPTGHEATDLHRTTWPLLMRGAKGDAVERWQRILASHGYDLGVRGIDGDFGTATDIATRGYQIDRRLTVDGIVGSETWGSVSKQSPRDPLGSRLAPSVGHEALRVAQELRDDGVAEIPGPEAHPVILACFACCERGGRIGAVALQSDEYAWCAAFFSYCQLEAERRHGLTRADTRFIPRAAVWELHRDAVLRLRFHTASDVRAEQYVPQPGDGWVQVRTGHTAGHDVTPFTSTGGLGHVGRIARVDGEHIWTIDGNVNDTITEVRRNIRAKEFIGIIQSD